MLQSKAWHFRTQLCFQTRLLLGYEVEMKSLGRLPTQNEVFIRRENRVHRDTESYNCSLVMERKKNRQGLKAKGQIYIMHGRKLSSGDGHTLRIQEGQQLQT